MIVVRDKIESMIEGIASSGTVDTFTDNGDGTYTITTTDTGNLAESFKVVLQYSSTSKDVIIDTVDDTSFTFSGSNITEPDTWQMALYFEYGHRVELNKKYINKAKSINKNVQEYPLVWMYTDFEQTPSDFEGVEFETTLQFALVDFTQKDLYEEERISEKFKPILYPILELIDTEFNGTFKKDNIVTPYGIEKEILLLTVDRPFFGSQDQNANVLPEPTDAIEFQVDLRWKEDYTQCSGYY